MHKARIWSFFRQLQIKRALKHETKGRAKQHIQCARTYRLSLRFVQCFWTPFLWSWRAPTRQKLPLVLPWLFYILLPYLQCLGHVFVKYGSIRFVVTLPQFGDNRPDSPFSLSFPAFPEGSSFPGAPSSRFSCLGSPAVRHSPTRLHLPCFPPSCWNI